MTEGLLGFLQSPVAQGLLSAGLGYAANAGRGGTWNSIGRAGLAGLAGVNNAMEQQKALEEEKRKRQFLMSIPAPENASPAANLTYQGVKAGVIPITEYLKAVQPKQLEYGKVDPKDYTPESLREASTTGDYTKLVPVRKMEVVGNQAVNLYDTKPGTRFDQVDPNKPFSLVGGQLVPNSAYQNYELNKARAGKTDVTVNTGQKGLENELKIRGEFKSEPIYKAHQDVQAAYQQITQSLKQESPAGDMAGATKIMKLLDPGSVVRESELGMAMAATGMLDRAQNYAQMVISGQKLTPQQRKDFQNLADVLYQESTKQYNAKRGEYAGFAKDYGLNDERILGPSVASPKLPKPAAPASGGVRFLGFE